MGLTPMPVTRAQVWAALVLAAVLMVAGLVAVALGVRWYIADLRAKVETLETWKGEAETRFTATAESVTALEAVMEDRQQTRVTITDNRRANEARFREVLNEDADARTWAATRIPDRVRSYGREARPAAEHGPASADARGEGAD